MTSNPEEEDLVRYVLINVIIKQIFKMTKVATRRNLLPKEKFKTSLELVNEQKQNKTSPRCSDG